MKQLRFFFLTFISLLLVSCNTHFNKESSSNLIGIWQNLENPEIAIEFEESGYYYLLKNKERLIYNEPVVMTYSYQPKQKVNFSLSEITANINYKGTLTFLTENKINIELPVNESLKLGGDYSRISN